MRSNQTDPVSLVRSGCKNARRKLQENPGISPQNLQMRILKSRAFLSAISGLGILRGRLVDRELLINPDAVAAASKAGVELIPPKKPIPEIEARTESNYIDLTVEIWRLKRIIGILSGIICFVLFFLMHFLIPYVATLMSLVSSSVVLILIVMFAWFAIFFGAPVGIFYLLARWGRIFSAEQ